MTVRSRSLLAAAAGLCVALPLAGQEPARLPAKHGQTRTLQVESNPNQQLADTIVNQLKQSPQLKDYRIDITVQDGVASLSGTVTNQAQRDEAIRVVQSVAGVAGVSESLTLAGTIAQAQGVSKAESIGAPRQMAASDLSGEPTPIFTAPVAGPHDLNPPRMPPHAWPTYAPYNNFSRVAYPTAYPHQAFPFIGPAYPFPKVPLGWRKVKLEWEDGHWWFSKVACQHDWWRLRYW